jgi:hypothetical protein
MVEQRPSTARARTTAQRALRARGGAAAGDVRPGSPSRALAVAVPGTAAVTHEQEVEGKDDRNY